MGILNVTPDSFSDGGRYLDREAAIAGGIDLFGQGADIVDVGGESTRPGSDPVDEAEEARRVVPVITELSRHGRVSIDTRHRSVAEEAVAAGASMINDVSRTLWTVAAEATSSGRDVAYAGFHMQGTPKTMQQAPTYGDVVTEVRDELVAMAEAAAGAGVQEVWIDPGIGFGKTLEHNLALLARLRELVATGWPVLVGASRKGFLGTLTGGAEARDRLEPSIAAATWAYIAGAGMVRAHDVAPTVAAVRIAFEEVG